MFNRIVLAGRLTRAPEPMHSPHRGTELELEADHIERWGDCSIERCRVRVRIMGEKRAEVVERWMEAGRPIQVTGHLIADEKGLLIEAEQWDFLANDLVTYGLWSSRSEGPPSPAGRNVPPDAAPAPAFRGEPARQAVNAPYPARPTAPAAGPPRGTVPVRPGESPPAERRLMAAGARPLEMVVPGEGHAF